MQTEFLTRAAKLLTQYENAEQWMEQTQPGTDEELIAKGFSNKAWMELDSMGVQLYDENMRYIGRQSLEQLSKEK